MGLLRKRIADKVGERKYRIFPYVQRHEFENLLFSRVDDFSILPEADSNAIQTLRGIRSNFWTPEDINDNKDTAPSKRIKSAIPRFHKVNSGPSIARRTGLEKTRAECPRFNEWIKKLENPTI